MKKVHYSFSDSDLQELETRQVPLTVKMRFILNLAGFKFKDDGQPSSVINLVPEPLGELRQWRDEKTMTTHYEQTI